MIHNPSLKPNISIIIPNYNSSPYIIETLESCLSQTYQNFEVIIVDDGSTDDSVSLIQKFIQNDTRISLFKQENKGPSSARNKGTELSKGEFLFYLDADDVLFPFALEKLYSNIGEADAVAGNLYRFYNTDVLIPDVRIFNPKFPHLSIIKYAPMCGTVLIRKSAIIHPWNSNYDGVEEFHFFVSHAARGVKYKRIDFFVLRYRQHAGVTRMSNLESVNEKLFQKTLNVHLEASEIISNTTDKKYSKSFFSILFLTYFYYCFRTNKKKTINMLLEKIKLNELYTGLTNKELSRLFKYNRFALAVPVFIYYKIFNRVKSIISNQ